MKKTTVIILLAIVSNLSFAQNVNLFNQNDVNNFSTNYPGDNSFTSITVNGNDITNLNGLSQVTEITGNLFITSPSSTNYPLTDISGLNNITTIGGKLTLSNLKFVDGSNLFPNLTQLGTSGGNQQGLTIVGLTPNTINGFNNLLNIAGDLAINNTTTLVTLSGFNSLTKVKAISSNNQSMFYFLNNSALTTINGFGNLNEIGWDYYFVNNPNLISLPNTPSLTVIGKSITISQCDSLINLNGLNSVTSLINGNLNINQNNNLTSFDGLNNLNICFGVSIQNNPVLTNLSALLNLTTFNVVPIPNRPTINISNNNALSSLTGLDNINGSTIGNVTLQNNSNLTLCAIESFCEKITFDTSLLGFTQVNNNATNCNSADDINSGCLVLSIEENDSNTILLYPNPANSVINVSNSADYSEIIISDMLGRIRIKKISYNGTIDVSDLEKGIYLVQAKIENRIARIKLIKE